MQQLPLSTPFVLAEIFDSQRPSSGTPDDDDDADDEHSDENEARVGATDENTDLSEEFEIDDEDVETTVYASDVRNQEATVEVDLEDTDDEENEEYVDEEPE